MSNAIITILTLAIHASVWVAVFTNNPYATRIVYAVAALSVLLPCVLFALVVMAIATSVKLTRVPGHPLRRFFRVLDIVEVIALIAFGWWFCAAAFAWGCIATLIMSQVINLAADSNERGHAMKPTQ